MSNIGKLITIGVVGVVCYYTFIEKRNPLAKFWSNPIEEANKDYVKHKTQGESAIAEKNATILQDDKSQRVITNNP
ncbi:MAG: hypothetical protein K2P17_06475 [Helicobacteraceae bacterium]|nr:hypothetical protein [Helicobacteraceae bacterium]